jgi:hypothetical protein
MIHLLIVTNFFWKAKTISENGLQLGSYWKKMVLFSFGCTNNITINKRQDRQEGGSICYMSPKFSIKMMESKEYGFTKDLNMIRHIVEHGS